MDSPEEILHQQAENKFDRNLKIVAGVISVLGVAATTVMTIMEAEKEVRKKMKQVKGRHRTVKKGGKKKALKAPPKKKAAKLKPIINERQLLRLEKQAEKVLDQAQHLKEEAKNGNGKLSTS
jgi:thiamine phosphate synthase YjbQ (UPF0047 family)